MKTLADEFWSNELAYLASQCDLDMQNAIFSTEITAKKAAYHVNTMWYRELPDIIKKLIDIQKMSVNAMTFKQEEKYQLLAVMRDTPGEYLLLGITHGRQHAYFELEQVDGVLMEKMELPSQGGPPNLFFLHHELVDITQMKRP